MDFSASVATKDAARIWRRRSCTLPRFSSTLPTRIFFGNAGPNKVASFHMVGLVMDRVYREGDLVSPPAHDLQTALVPPGGAAVVDVSTPVPGMYAMLDHAIFRTAKGAMGFLKVTGSLRPDIYTGDEPYDPTAEMRH